MRPARGSSLTKLLREIPGMPFRISAVVAALPVALIRGLIDDLRPGCTRPFAMRIDVIHVHVKEHGCPPEATWATRLGRLPKMDLPTSESHLAMTPPTTRGRFPVC